MSERCDQDSSGTQQKEANNRRALEESHDFQDQGAPESGQSEVKDHFDPGDGDDGDD